MSLTPESKQLIVNLLEKELETVTSYATPGRLSAKGQAKMLTRKKIAKAALKEVQ